MHLRDLHRNAPKPSAGAVIVGPWPSYSAFRHLPEQQRWVLYGSAKAYRESLEDLGMTMSESYDDFVKRVTAELEI